MGDYAQNKTKVRAIWEIFHPIPRQLPRAYRVYRSSHLLFRRERTRLVHLTVHGHPFSSQTTPHLSHTRNPAQHKFAAIVPRWARTMRSYESIDDRMTLLPLACPPRISRSDNTSQGQTLSHTESSGISALPLHPS
jgi:hypothetical protein